MRIALGIFILFLTGCTYGINTMGYSDQSLSLDEAWQQTSMYEYLNDPPGGYWKSPKEFEADGGGDCEDFSVYMLYLLGDETAFLVVLQEQGSTTLHAVIEYQGELLEPQAYRCRINPEKITIKHKYSFADIMISTTRFGTKQLEVGN